MSSNPLIFLVGGAAVLVGVWWYMKEQEKRRRRHHRREGFNGSKTTDFERVALINSGRGDGRYWRSHVDYEPDLTKSPHYQADPHDETIPLNMSVHAPGLQMLPTYTPSLTGGQYTPGSGDFVKSLSDDYSSQKSLYESGNMDYKRMLHATREDGVYGDYQTDFSMSMALKAQ